MSKARILFVDDEASIRLTLPAILQMHGFDVRTEGSVTDALTAINEDRFEVLIADLNIGMPGDGFTVVSAMRRTQPEAVTIILTGYPAFETALEAIRSQVDDYAVKPANIEDLVQVIEDKLRHREPHRPMPKKPVATILRESSGDIVHDFVDEMRKLKEVAALELDDQELIDSVPMLVGELIGTLEGGSAPTSRLGRSAEHGRTRRKQGFKLPFLISEYGVLHRLLLRAIQDNLLAVDVSNVLNDIVQIEDVSARQLREAVEAFTSRTKIAA
ncbi:response regulator receiver protein [Candidatus Koribacter versatilis Ellin345]|uniref:Response regulator receiver protein n=1 Tax=Koribacter versatilis (strain Ellin345) TaxID=204669 RepID=Q1IIK9_KORVE|nr:response regulator [Candidatus Koribacter versatilis]ABF43291.1 response regulator receiver protein [Candidatus Koribacter versatilis Ellin345]